MNSFKDPKFVVAYTIILGFAAAYVNRPDDTMNGALIAAFAGAWGFYLGSSNSSSQIREQMGTALDLAKAHTPVPAPDVSLAPGETTTIGTEPTSKEQQP
jgi:hypothetical protein